MSIDAICLRCTMPACDETSGNCLYRRRIRELRELKKAMAVILPGLKKARYDRQRYLHRKANGL